MQLSEAIEKYITWKSSYTSKAPITYKIYLKIFEQFIEGKGIEDIKLDDVVAFQLALKKRYSLASVAYHTMILKNFFDFWLRQDMPVLDPFLIKIPKFTPNSHATLSHEEYLKMEAVCSANLFGELTKKLVIRFLWETGMRVSEVCDLKVSDIDSKRTSALIQTKKNRKMRWVFWTKETHDLLLKYLSTRICLNSRPALFIAAHGNRDKLNPRSIQRWIKEIAAKAGIVKKVSPHSFRHGKAHRILDLGGTVKDIQQLLGHSEENPKSSFSYLRLNPTEIEKRARVFLKGG